MTDLRPIGTRFTEVYQPPKNSTELMAIECEYEVVAHVKTARFLGDTEGPMAERLKIISRREVLPESVSLNDDGSMTVTYEL